MDDKRLFLLDAYALIYRAYYAMMRSPRITSKGLNTSAIMGFVNSLDEVMKKGNPTHIAVCFDPSGPTFRHEAYHDYKANREKQPEDITIAVPYIKRILEAMNIAVIERPGYEADDVIGTLARHAEAQGFITYMMTPDKDYAQLVTDRILQYKPPMKGDGFEIRGPKEVCEKFEIQRPEQVIDILALEGDSSDNIPGCPGIGKKTARKLLAQYDTAENIISHAQDIKGSVGLKVVEGAESIIFSKFLATIKTDVPTLEGFNLESLAIKSPDIPALIKVYDELEFKTFINKLKSGKGGLAAIKVITDSSGMGNLFDFAEPETSAEIPLEWDEARTVEAVTAAVERIHKASRVGIAFIAPGDNAMTARWEGVAVAADDGHKPVVIIIPREKGVEREAVLNVIRSVIEDPKITLVGHDIKRGMVQTMREGMEFEAAYTDTAILHYLLEPEMKHDLPLISPVYISKDIPEIDIDTPEGAAVAASTALLLINPLLEKIDKAGLRKLLDDVELPLVRVLADMEYTGARVDTAELAVLSKEYGKRLSEMEHKVYELAGTTFNVSSPAQVGEVLFEKLKIDDNAKRTKKGAYSTTEEILTKYAHDWPVVDLILKIRALRKLLGTYVNALPTLVNPATGKIHTTYNQTVTATGRISSTNPNLQNIPVRTDDGREIRRAFVSDPGDLFVSADYSQIELRLMADLSGDPDMIAAFRDGQDIHRATAAKIYHLPLSEVTDTQRRNAKTANFGIIYGISAFGLAERLGIPRSEAKELIDGYFRSYPHISEYIGNAIKQARIDGFVTTIMGRRRILADINSRNATVRAFAERNAVNAPIQGSAADIIKLAMVRIWRKMRSLEMKSKMIIQVHDELIFNVKPDELPDLQAIIVTEMADAYSGKVRLEVSAGTATNWLEAH